MKEINKKANYPKNNNKNKKKRKIDLFLAFRRKATRWTAKAMIWRIATIDGHFHSKLDIGGLYYTLTA